MSIPSDGSTLRPLSGRLLVRLDLERTMIGRIHIPSQAVQEMYSAEVLAVGVAPVNMKTGQRYDQLFAVGDHVLFRRFEGQELGGVFDDRLALLRWEDMVGFSDGEQMEYAPPDSSPLDDNEVV